MERARILIKILTPFLQILPFFLYAETHYRFRYFFSFLRKNEPEIIADAPHRIEPGQKLPILVLVKDAHQYPIKLNKITIVIYQEGKTVIEKDLLSTPVKINEKLFWKIYDIPLKGISGIMACDVLFEIDNGKKQLSYHNDNHRTSSHKLLKIFAAPFPLPRFKYLHFGECHSHSNYTNDQVEFGAPLEASVKLSRALGLSFFCATDHSYDLDDSSDNYLINDKNLPKWREMQQEVDDENSKTSDLAIIRGEEITCRNSKDQNIHLLLLGNRKFFHGSGDSAEKWLKTYSENNIDDILDEVEQSVTSFAAHPKERISFFQSLLLRRGQWDRQDINNSKLTGIQFANGHITDGFWEGYRQWIEALSSGKKLYILAGNDAHGNFNRFRQIGIPFFKIRETGHQLFGKMRTGVFIESISEKNILQAIRAGRTIITDGPVANIITGTQPINSSNIGESIIGKKHLISLEVKSSNEYGSIDSIKVIICYIGANESVAFSEKITNEYTVKRDFALEIEKKCYIRAEIWTLSYNSIDAQSHFCMTNPIWLSPV
jgi:hypothetical protein